jgi:tRNA uracil 4-sulfurtransferase
MTLQAIVRYHEIALKGRNRPFFVDKLAVNLRRATADLPGVSAQLLGSRIAVRAPDELDWDVLKERLAHVFGVANFSRAHTVTADPELSALKEAVGAALEGRTYRSFRVTCRRSWKQFVRDSGYIERELGAFVNARTGWKVNLQQPELVLLVEVVKERMLFSFERIPGPGGFPMGGSGRVVALLSGGIDSPVAAWRLMKRGCNVTLVNCHAFPLQDRTMIDKVRDLAHLLTRWQYRTHLWLVPFGKLQQEIVAACPAPLRVVLYRRFMLRIAEALARNARGQALVTGDSLGQVASQTLENLCVIDQAASIPVLRPLVAMDKEEITAQAQALGTFQISTLPDQDCCQLFVPKSPALAAKLEEVLAAEALLDVPALVQEALRGSELERLRFPEGDRRDRRSRI